MGNGEMNRTNTDDSKWRIFPDERYYRFVKSFSVKFTKGEWNANSYWYSTGHRLPIRRSSNPEGKHAIQVESSYHSPQKIIDVPQDIAECIVPKMDSGTLYSGWISAADSPNNTIQIDIYERLQIPCSEITSISWHSGGFCPTSESLTITSRDRCFHYWIETWGKRDSPDISFRFSPEQWNNFVQPAFQKCNFMAWADKDAYYNHGVFDGEQWSMTIRQGRKHLKDISASNDYPEEWDYFMHFISTCRKLCKRLPGEDLLS